MLFNIVESAALRGIPAIVIDYKGDLANILLASCGRFSKQDQLSLFGSCQPMFQGYLKGLQRLNNDMPDGEAGMLRDVQITHEYLTKSSVEDSCILLLKRRFAEQSAPALIAMVLSDFVEECCDETDRRHFADVVERVCENFAQNEAVSTDAAHRILLALRGVAGKTCVGSSAISWFRAKSILNTVLNSTEVKKIKLRLQVLIRRLSLHDEVDQLLAANLEAAAKFQAALIDCGKTADDIVEIEEFVSIAKAALKTRDDCRTRLTDHEQLRASVSVDNLPLQVATMGDQLRSARESAVNALNEALNSFDAFGFSAEERGGSVWVSDKSVAHALSALETKRCCQSAIDQKRANNVHIVDIINLLQSRSLMTGDPFARTDKVAAGCRVRIVSLAKLNAVERAEAVASFLSLSILGGELRKPSGGLNAVLHFVLVDV
jgi:hypothetical protein